MRTNGMTIPLFPFPNSCTFLCGHFCRLSARISRLNSFSFFRSNPLCPTFLSFSLSVGVARTNKRSASYAPRRFAVIAAGTIVLSDACRSAADLSCLSVCLSAPCRVALRRSPLPPIPRSIVISSSSRTQSTALHSEGSDIARVIAERDDPSSDDSNSESNRASEAASRRGAETADPPVRIRRPLRPQPPAP